MKDKVTCARAFRTPLHDLMCLFTLPPYFNFCIIRQRHTCSHWRVGHIYVESITQECFLIPK